MALDRPLNVIIVEDEALLALDLECMVEEAGNRVVAGAASLREMNDIPSDIEPDLAFVDLHLAEGSSGLDVSRYIQTHWTGVIIVFVTANPSKLPPDLSGAHGVIAKPFSRTSMMKALKYLGEGILAPPPSSAAPSTLVTSSHLPATWH